MVLCYCFCFDKWKWFIQPERNYSAWAILSARSRYIYIWKLIPVIKRCRSLHLRLDKLRPLKSPHFQQKPNDELHRYCANKSFYTRYLYCYEIFTVWRLLCFFLSCVQSMDSMAMQKRLIKFAQFSINFRSKWKRQQMEVQIATIQIALGRVPLVNKCNWNCFPTKFSVCVALHSYIHRVFA